MPDGKMFGAPGHALSHVYEPCGHSAGRHGGFAPVNVPSQVHLDAAGEIEAATDGCMDDRNFFQSDHETPCFERVQLKYERFAPGSQTIFEPVQNPPPCTIVEEGISMQGPLANLEQWEDFV